MYLPRHFAETEPAAIAELVRRVAFGHLVVNRVDTLDAVPLPFVVDDELRSVRAHVAKANPIWKAAPSRALLIVPISDGYVSPGWYPSKAEHGEVVPTWNYEVVHIHGELVTHERDWTAQLVRDLTDLHERHRPDPWSVDDAPAPYRERLLGAIVGIELRVDRVEAKRKLSQNKSGADRDGVIAGLRDEPGSTALAAAMRSVADTLAD